MIQLSNNNNPNAQWKEIVRGELDDPRDKVKSMFHKDNYRLNVTRQTFDVENKKGRYVRFICDTNWAGTCALHSIAIMEREPDNRIDDDFMNIW